MTEDKRWTGVVRLGVRKILDNANVLSDQEYLAHRYYNALIELRRADRERYRAIRSKAVPELEAAQRVVAETSEAIEALLDGVRKRRKRESVKDGAVRPKRSELTAEEKTELDRLKALKKEARIKAGELSHAFEDLLLPARAEFDRRTTGAPASLLEQIRTIGAQLKAAKKIKDNPDVPKLQRTHAELKRRKADIAPKTHQKGAANARVLEEMLSEPEWSATWKEVATLEAETLRELKRLRSESQLTHGTYAAVEDAVDQAFRTAEDMPGFRRWSGGRKVGAQLQATRKGFTTWGDVLDGKDPRLKIRLSDAPRGSRDPKLRKERNPNALSRFKRYGIGELRLEKSTVTFEVQVHRDIPRDARVLWAYLVPKRRGLVNRHELQVTVSLPEPLVKREYGDGTANVTLGWSRAEDAAVEDRGLIVARINGEPLVMPGNILTSMTYARAVRSIADQHFQADDGSGARDQLRAWMKAHPDLVPEWMAKETGHIDKWRDHAKLARVAMRWAEDFPSIAAESRKDPNSLFQRWKRHRDALREEFGADAGDLFVTRREVLDEWLGTQGIHDESERMAIWLTWWHIKDAHLTNLWAGVDAKALGRRNDFYRCAASNLAKRFGSVKLLELDLASTARRAKTEDKDPMLKIARYHRRVAAVSNLKIALREVFGERYSVAKRERSGDAPESGGARKGENQGDSRDIGDAAE